ncbi:hypothetical protein Tdes44962_MAKER01722 [Teratosphaeria destructans]|uniref:Uncharacterized protein n=1 Tax=Teratosphaeria destructans TaxID=418781 RepID=A0A9W7SWY6_9PEZI|nr:hypothetical protein Tdes44962_MAKER01722 [Teratosphaeria destructans]
MYPSETEAAEVQAYQMEELQAFSENEWEDVDQANEDSEGGDDDENGEGEDDVGSNVDGARQAPQEHGHERF